MKGNKTGLMPPDIIHTQQSENAGIKVSSCNLLHGQVKTDSLSRGLLVRLMSVERLTGNQRVLVVLFW